MMNRKKMICIGLAAVLAIGMAVMTGCGKKEEEKAETTVTTTTEPTTTTEKETTKEKTYKDLYQSKLDALIDEYGGVNGGKLVDLDDSGTPEMVVFSGVAPNFAIDIFTIEDDEVVNVYEKTFSGLRYWQSDASYEVWFNESISPTTITLFDSSDEWTEDKAYAVSMNNGAISTEELEAKAKGEPDDPDWSNCKCSINGEKVSSNDYGRERDRLEIGADTINPASADLDGLKSALKE